jgi:branched-chain amino acid transport system substrate-binding protein
LASLSNRPRGGLIWSAVAASVLLMVLAVPGSRAGDEPVRIGEIDPLTGKLAMHGMEIHQGIVYAVEEANLRGGLQGRLVELISRDDQSQPEVAINQVQELIYREKVVGLVGGYVDSLVGPVSELAAKHSLPYVASASLQQALTQQRANPYFFRVARLDGIVTPLCRFIIQDLKPRRTAVVYSATPGSTEFGGAVKACLEKAGIEIAVFEKFRPNTLDFSALILRVGQERVEILVSGGFFPDHLVLVRQLRQQKIPLKGYLGPWGVSYQNFIREMGDMSEGVFGTCAWNPGITLQGTEQESQDLVANFQKRFGQLPNTTTMHGYTSARALLAAIDPVLQRRDALTGDAVRRELAKLDLKLPMEHLKFDQNGDPEYYQHVVVQIQNGQMVVVYPPERATGGLIYPMKNQ